MAEWKTGDVITAERLNGMQKEPLIFTDIEEGTISTLTKTWKEIDDAVRSGATAIYNSINEYDGEIYSVESHYVMTSYNVNDGQYSVKTVDSNVQWTANSENGYPYANYD